MQLRPGEFSAFTNYTRKKPTVLIALRGSENEQEAVIGLAGFPLGVSITIINQHSAKNKNKT